MARRSGKVLAEPMAEDEVKDRQEMLKNASKKKKPLDFSVPDDGKRYPTTQIHPVIATGSSPGPAQDFSSSWKDSPTLLQLGEKVTKLQPYSVTELRLMSLHLLLDVIYDEMHYAYKIKNWQHQSFIGMFNQHGSVSYMTATQWGHLNRLLASLLGGASSPVLDHLISLFEEEKILANVPEPSYKRS